MSDIASDGPTEQAMNAVEAFEANKTPKIIRVLTVCAYLICVSLAAIMLSVYYIFLWEPKSHHDPTTSPSMPTHTATVHRKH